MHLSPVELDGQSYTIQQSSVSSEEIFRNNKNITRAALLYPYHIVHPLAGYFERFFTTASILIADDNSQPSPTQIFANSYTVSNPHQGWFWSPENDVIDVIVKRSRIDMGSYNSNLPVVFTTNDGIKTELELPGGKNYGFARLVKQGNFWVIDNDYAVNLTQKGHFFSNTTTIASNTTFTDDVYFYGQQDELKIRSHVTFAPGSTVWVKGSNMKIVVENGGRITANNVTFKQVSGSFQGVHLKTAGSVIEYSTFENSATGLRIMNGSNILRRNTFRNNIIGVYVYPGTSVTMQGNSFRNNGDGIRNYGRLTIEKQDITGNTFIASSFTDNTNGVENRISGVLYAYNTKFRFNINSVKVKNSSRFIPGTYGGGNAFYNASDHHIYNGSNAAVYANAQYWNSGGTPYSLQFHGTVYRNSPQSQDPTLFNSGDGGNECQEGDYEICPEEQGPWGSAKIMASQNNKNGATVTSKNHKKRSRQKVLKRLNKYYKKLKRSYHKKSSLKYMNYLYEILDRYEFDGKQNQYRLFKEELEAIINLYEQQYLQEEVNFEDFNEKENRAALINEETGLKALNYYLSVLITLGDYELAVAKANDFLIFNLSELKKAEMLSYKIDALIQSEKLNQALSVIAELERLEEQIYNRSTSEDYQILKAMLTEQIIEKNGTVEEPETKEKPTADNQDKLPDEFSLKKAYPNPFNPTTVIPFSMKRDGKAHITVYDVTGRLVSELVNDNISAGQHQVIFDGANLSSGVYFIRGILDGHNFTQKITLIK